MSKFIQKTEFVPSRTYVIVRGNVRETIECYITEEFDSNHILHMNSDKRGELNVWWGYSLPTKEQVIMSYDKHRPM
jgi:hypothetical protein